MGFLDLPVEIRLRIYTYILILAEPIIFVADYGPSSPPLFRYRRDGLCPALLRVNRKIYHEAVPLLYSQNRFQFPDVLTLTPPATDFAYFSPFLRQVGSQANLIKHIRMNFPDINCYRARFKSLHEAHVNGLELIRDTCTHLRTLELSLNIRAGPLEYSPEVAEALGALDKIFQDIISLKEIIVNLEVYSDVDLSDSLLKSMCEYGWLLKVTQREFQEAVWICDEHGIELRSEEAYIAYMDRIWHVEEEESSGRSLEHQAIPVLWDKSGHD